MDPDLNADLDVGRETATALRGQEPNTPKDGASGAGPETAPDSRGAQAASSLLLGVDWMVCVLEGKVGHHV